MRRIFESVRQAECLRYVDVSVLRATAMYLRSAAFEACHRDTIRHKVSQAQSTLNTALTKHPGRSSAPNWPRGVCRLMLVGGVITDSRQPRPKS